jgi:hypothetical protein
LLERQPAVTLVVRGCGQEVRAGEPELLLRGM